MKKRIVHIVVIVLALLTISSCKEQARSDLRKGNAFYKNLKYHDALASYQKAFAKYPELTASQFNLAAALYKMNKFDSATAVLQRLSENPLTDSLNRILVHYNLATTRLSWAIANKQTINKLIGAVTDMEATVDEQMDIIDKVKQSIELDSMVVLQDSLEKTTLELLYKSINGYKMVLRAHPADSLSRYNLAYAQTMLPKSDYDNMKNKDQQQKESLTAYAKKIKVKADSLVKNYVFDTAYQLMDKGIKKDTTVKTYNEYINKLKNVNDIKYKKNEKK